MITYPHCLLITLITILHYTHSYLLLNFYAQSKFDYFLVLPSASQSNFNCMIDLTSQYTWINEPKEANYQRFINHKTNSQLNEEVTITYGKESYVSKVIRDTITLEDNYYLPLQDFKIALIKTDNADDEGIRKYSNCSMGFAYAFDNPKSSFIHQLKEQNIIREASFAFIRGKYLIMFGGIPLEDTKDRYYSYCNVMNNSTEWNCWLSSLTIEGVASMDIPTSTYTITKPSEHRLSIGTNNELHYVPKGFFNFLKSIYARQISNADCVIQKASGTRFLMCSSKANIKGGSIVFRIGDFDYRIDMKHFWTCDKHECYLTLRENSFDKDHWVLGSSIHALYNMKFDYDNKKIHFYSKEGVIAIRRRKMKMAIIGSMIMMISGIAWVYMIKKTMLNH